jgi:hypothetical protein
MRLFANGCSFTWGGAIFPSLYDETGALLDYDNTSPLNQQRLSTVWPAKLGTLLAAEETVNLSMGCGSNDRILRTTLDFFSNLVSRKYDMSEWMAVIQFTQAHRYEYWDDQTKTWAMVIPNSVTPGKSMPRDKDNEYKRDVTYSYLNDISFAQKYFTQVVGLAGFLEKHNIQYRFINLVMDPWNYLSPTQSDYLKKHVKWVGDEPYLTMPKIFSDVEGTDHPSIIGHDQISQSLYGYIKDDLSD